MQFSELSVIGFISLLKEAKHNEHKRTSSNSCMSQNANYAITVTK